MCLPRRTTTTDDPVGMPSYFEVLWELRPLGIQACMQAVRHAGNSASLKGSACPSHLTGFNKVRPLSGNKVPAPSHLPLYRYGVLHL